MANRRDDLVVVEHDGEQTSELAGLGKVLHRPMAAGHEHAVVVVRRHIFENRRSGEDGEHPARYAARPPAHLPRPRWRQTGVVNRRHHAAGGRDGHIDAGVAEHPQRLDELLGPEAGRMTRPIRERPPVRAREGNQQPRPLLATVL
jgi:hypothetical protein